MIVGLNIPKLDGEKRDAFELTIKKCVKSHFIEIMCTLGDSVCVCCFVLNARRY